MVLSYEVEGDGGVPPIRRVREPAGREREMFCRPVLPSGKAKVRSLTSIVGEGMAASESCCDCSRWASDDGWRRLAAQYGDM